MNVIATDYKISLNVLIYLLFLPARNQFLVFLRVTPLHYVKPTNIRNSLTYLLFCKYSKLREIESLISNTKRHRNKGIKTTKLIDRRRKNAISREVRSLKVYCTSIMCVSNYKTLIKLRFVIKILITKGN